MYGPHEGWKALDSASEIFWDKGKGLGSRGGSSGVFPQTVYFPKPFTVGFSLRKKRLAAICSGRVPGACPPRVRPVSALSTLSPLWPRLQTLSAMCPPCLGLRPPCVRPFGCASKPCLPCVRLAFCPSCVCLSLAPGLCPLLACCAAGPWHHQAKFFRTIAQPTVFKFISHGRWSVSFICSFGSPNSAFASALYT